MISFCEKNRSRKTEREECFQGKFASWRSKIFINKKEQIGQKWFSYPQQFMSKFSDSFLFFRNIVPSANHRAVFHNRKALQESPFGPFVVISVAAKLSNQTTISFNLNVNPFHGERPPKFRGNAIGGLLSFQQNFSLEVFSIARADDIFPNGLENRHRV
jgi:hypothetical protein